MESIKYAVIQSGYAVFGVGHTYEQAINDASNWLESDYGKQGDMTFEEVEALIQPKASHVDGEFIILESSDDDFDSYMENQGGFEKIDGEWFDAK